MLQHSPTHLGSREDSGSIEMGGMADGLGTMIKRERRKEQNRAAQRVFRAKAKIQNQEVSISTSDQDGISVQFSISPALTIFHS